MAISTTYIAIEAMLQQGWVMMNLAEFEKLLDLFEKKGMISRAEQHDLLDLAKTAYLDKLPGQGLSFKETRGSLPSQRSLNAGIGDQPD